MGLHLDFTDFVYPELSIDACRRIYSYMINSIPHQSTLEYVLGEAFLRPSLTKKVGRLKKIHVREKREAVVRQRR